MKRSLRTAMMAILVMVFMVCLMAPAAMAAYEPVMKEVPVTIFMQSKDETGGLPDRDEIPVTVTALTDGSPISGESSFTVSTSGSEGTSVNIRFGPFSKPGIHEYGVAIGTSSHEYILDDAPVYYAVRVTVTNKGDYSGLESTVAVRLSDASFSPDERLEKGAIEDTNTYLSPYSITVVKRWANSRGFPVRMNLIRIADVQTEDGSIETVKEIVDTVYVSPRNNWQYTFSDLDPRYEWTVEEAGVHGYYSSYAYDYSNPHVRIITVTNHKSLYQTGQLNWPIPVLMCFGSVLVLAGVMMLRRKEEPTHE